MTQEQIQNAIWRRIGKRFSIMLPRYTPPNWFECDVWAMTKARYYYEWEIKITVKDFLADAHKKITIRSGGRTEVKNKHELLSHGDTFGPSRFWYAVPPGLLDLSMIPPWAGLLEVKTDGRWPVVKEVKKAPVLHRSQYTLDRDRVLTSCYYRMWDRTVELGKLRLKFKPS